MKKELYETYVQVLKDELLPAMGCTEPIAVAYAGAVVRQTLGNIPERVEIQVSRNIIKNVKSVIVPHTGGLRGIEAAAAIGIVAGDAKAQHHDVGLVVPGDVVGVHVHGVGLPRQGGSGKRGRTGGGQTGALDKRAARNTRCACRHRWISPLGRFAGPQGRR